MIDTKKLEEVIKESGYRIQFLEKSLNLSPQAFLNKRYGKKEFTVGEALILKNVLKLSDQETISIFFTEEVEK